MIATCALRQRTHALKRLSRDRDESRCALVTFATTEKTLLGNEKLCDFECLSELHDPSPVSPWTPKQLGRFREALHKAVAWLQDDMQVLVECKGGKNRSCTFARCLQVVAAAEGVALDSDNSLSHPVCGDLRAAVEAFELESPSLKDARRACDEAFAKLTTTVD